jgi:hypothetical protein
MGLKWSLGPLLRALDANAPILVSAAVHERSDFFRQRVLF